MGELTIIKYIWTFTQRVIYTKENQFPWKKVKKKKKNQQNVGSFGLDYFNLHSNSML